MSSYAPASDQGKWAALFLCFLATVAIFIPYVGYSTQIVTMMTDLSMTYTMVGTLASASAVAGGIILPFAGLLVDRWGAKKITVLGLLVSAVGQVAFAYVPTYEAMLASRIFLGAGIPLLFIGPYTLALRWFEQSGKTGVAMGTMLATDGIGTLIALYAYSHVLNAYGWRDGSALGALALVAMMLVTLFFLKEPKTFSEAVPASSSQSMFRDLLAVIKERNVLVASVFLVGVWGSYAVAIYWVPTILMEQNGWSESDAGLIGALYPLVGMICAVSFGLMSDRFGRRKPLMLLSGIGMTLAFFGAAAALSMNNYTLLAAMLPLSGLFAYGGIPLAYCLAADTVGIKLAATANGIIMSIGFLLGGVVYPLVLGMIKDATGHYTNGFIAASISLVVLNIVATLFAREHVSSPKPTYA
ncbi:nitrate/nitrite transporter [Pseudomonas sp. O230]|uniref:MFS transporter n=1 Tax=Pseudomonas sp. O230 TaxID=3159450 RepID=UPI00387B5A36